MLRLLSEYVFRFPIYIVNRPLTLPELRHLLASCLVRIFKRVKRQEKNASLFDELKIIFAASDICH